MTPASAVTVCWPNTTTPFTSSAFIGMRPYKSILPLLGIQFHTTSTFHNFSSQISGMYGIGIRDAVADP